jgi:hemin uptake protein HemP
MNNRIERQSGEWTVEVKDNRVASKALLVSCKELIIQHMGDDYRLRITGNNKLILTK